MLVPPQQPEFAHLAEFDLVAPEASTSAAATADAERWLAGVSAGQR